MLRPVINGRYAESVPRPANLKLLPMQTRGTGGSLGYAAGDAGHPSNGEGSGGSSPGSESRKHSSEAHSGLLRTRITPRLRPQAANTSSLELQTDGSLPTAATSSCTTLAPPKALERSSAVREIKEGKSKLIRTRKRAASVAALRTVQRSSADSGEVLLKSFGNSAASSPPKPVKQLYVAQFGNYSSTIRQLLRNRSCWTPGPGDPGNSAGKTCYNEHKVKVSNIEDLPDIQFLWSQWTNKAFLDIMAENQTGWVVTVNEENCLKLKQREQKENPQEAPPMPPPVRFHNHFEGNTVITSKCGLRETMVAFYLSHGIDPFSAIPLTFVVRKGSSDEEFGHWQRAFDAISEAKGQYMWLVKPGDRANQGKGIVICDSKQEVEETVNSKERGWVIQKYMELPFLVHKRKFDIRSYCLLAQDPKDGSLRGYFYKEAYLRTTSAEYSLKTKDRFVHLNNDAVQKHGEDYGKFESANKMSLAEFQRYLDDQHRSDGFSVQEHLVPQMRSLMADALKAGGARFNPRNIKHCFEVFGFDFMVDASMRVWLIEVNTNPCLEPCNTHLARVIPKMLDEAFMLSLDQVFTPTTAQGKGVSNGWEKIYSSKSADANQVTCTWLPSLPDSQGSPLDLASLGGDLLSPRPALGKGMGKNAGIQGSRK